GVIITSAGEIITNNHVISGATSVKVKTSDGKSYTAQVVGTDSKKDLALIKLENASGLKPATLGNSDGVKVGDTVVAIGSPEGLTGTVTSGIVSALSRDVTVSTDESQSQGQGGQGSGGNWPFQFGGQQFNGDTGTSTTTYKALQTDASLNPGNSGGALIDAGGNIIGINSAMYSAAADSSSSDAGSVGLGFAIPINQAKYVAQQLIKTGEPVYAKIGASVSLADSTNGAKISESAEGGSSAVESGGPAAQAGLKPGDVITKLDDMVIDSGPTLIGEIWTHQPGDKVTITYERDGKTHTVDLTLGSRKGDS
ncbi:trypsin-like peptidase domain-containing protein, partial [Streptomyces sp. NPDC047097]|uniref:S1C family serine protease n=1 Tax=Streptomyces sp. NPDC047097 TaxID=3155260 RepID=UPI0033F77284